MLMGHLGLLAGKSGENFPGEGGLFCLALRQLYSVWVGLLRSWWEVRLCSVGQVEKPAGDSHLEMVSVFVNDGRLKDHLWKDAYVQMWFSPQPIVVLEVAQQLRLVWWA